MSPSKGGNVQKNNEKGLFPPPAFPFMQISHPTHDDPLHIQDDPGRTLILPEKAYLRTPCAGHHASVLFAPSGGQLSARIPDQPSYR